MSLRFGGIGHLDEAAERVREPRLRGAPRFGPRQKSESTASEAPGTIARCGRPSIPRSAGSY